MDIEIDSEKRTLTEDEMDNVSGGIAPIIVAGASLAMNATARSLGAALVSRGLAAYAVYDAAKSTGSSGRGKAKVVDETIAK